MNFFSLFLLKTRGRDRDMQNRIQMKQNNFFFGVIKVSEKGLILMDVA